LRVKEAARERVASERRERIIFTNGQCYGSAHRVTVRFCIL
jgi:hypothetical protein